MSILKKCQFVTYNPWGWTNYIIGIDYITYFQRVNILIKKWYHNLIKFAIIMLFEFIYVKYVTFYTKQLSFALKTCMCIHIFFIYEWAFFYQKVRFGLKVRFIYAEHTAKPKKYITSLSIRPIFCIKMYKCCIYLHGIFFIIIPWIILLICEACYIS